MSSKGKKKAASGGKKRSYTAAQRRAKRNVAKNSSILLWVTAIALVGIFVGRWVIAIGNGYFSTFVQVDAAAATAVSNMKDLVPNADERQELLPLQKSWDLFTSSRLRDEVTITAADGTELHGYLYNEGSDVTAVVLPRFYEDGTADFLPGVYLNQLTGCNILLPDPRMHGGSGGGYFTYGVKEQYDLAAWLDWADAALGKQTFIIWGEATGANTALMAAASGILPQSVAFIVAESPYASLHELAMEGIWKWFSVPRAFLYAVEGKLARSAAGFTVEDVDTVNALADAAPTAPVLFLTSAADGYILPAWSEAVSDAYAGPKDSFSGGGSHGTAYAAETDAVNALLAQWWAYYGAKG